MLPIPVSSTLLAIAAKVWFSERDSEPSARLSADPCGGKSHAWICEGGHPVAGVPASIGEEITVYIPPQFKIDDPESIRLFIEENSFGLLLSVDDGEIHDTHTPFVYSEDGRYLLGHIAKANPQWRSWADGATAKVVFRGAHTYISPRFYESEFAVPTWNYAAVSVAGRISVIDQEVMVLEFLDRLTAHHEQSEQPWILDRADERYIRLISGIVVFSVSIDAVEASFKMNQNKNEADQRKVIASLAETGCPFDGEVGAIMTSNITNAEQDPNA